MPVTVIRRWLPQKSLIDLALLLLLAGFTVAIISIYIPRERNFYWWIDWYSRTTLMVDLLQKNPLDAWSHLQTSLTWERNSLYTLPLLPFLLIFGKSRLVYQIALTLVYLLPFCLSLGAVATRLIPFHPRWVFWTTAWVAVLMPVNWSATFLGIPDTGGVTCIMVACWLYLQDVQLKDWRRTLTMGAMLAAAVLLRRHFVYGAIAFLGAIALPAALNFWVEFRQQRRVACKNFFNYGFRVGFVALTSLAVMLVVARDFTIAALTRNYSQLYISWSLPVPDLLEFYAHAWGLGVWGLALLGLVAGSFLHRLHPPAVWLVSLYGTIALLEWLGSLRYGNVFYLLHITPLLVLGLAALLWTAGTSLVGNLRWLTLTLTGGYLVSNLVLGLTPLGNFHNPLRPWFALNLPPLTRTDYGEVVRLVDYLRELAGDEATLYVAGTNRLQLNTGVLQSAERVLYGRDNQLKFLNAPQVDSRDAYPLDALLKADYVVISDPLMLYPGSLVKVPAIGEWLLPQEHDVVRVVVEAFQKNWQFSKDFRQLPTQFRLEDGATVSVYQRLRPTSIPVALQTLAAMQEKLGERPGGQGPWISLSSRFSQTAILRRSPNTFRLVSFPGKNSTNETSFLYLGPYAQKMEVNGWLDLWNKPCVGATLKFQWLDRQGNPQGQPIPIPTSTGILNFSKLIQGYPNAYLLLQVVSQKPSVKNETYCSVDINNLKILPRSSPHYKYSGSRFTPL